jgi:hypothetical protein
MGTKNSKAPHALTRGLFESARKALDDAPDLPAEQQPITMREGVASIRDSIEAAKARGYSVEKIAELLNAAGVDITAATLATYARSGQRPRNAKKTRTPKKTVASQMKVAAPVKSGKSMPEFNYNATPEKNSLL